MYRPRNYYFLLLHFCKGSSNTSPKPYLRWPLCHEAERSLGLIILLHVCTSIQPLRPHRLAWPGCRGEGDSSTRPGDPQSWTKWCRGQVHAASHLLWSTLKRLRFVYAVKFTMEELLMLLAAESDFKWDIGFQRLMSWAHDVTHPVLFS